MNFYRSLQLKNRKQKALAEVRGDIQFIEKYRADSLYYDDKEARDELKEQASIAEEDRDQERIDILSRAIAKSQSARKELEQLKEMEIDLQNYISML